jgi:hypothetical protein
VAKYNQLLRIEEELDDAAVYAGAGAFPRFEAEEKLLADPAYIEQQARIRFGAVKPGETPYRVSTVDPVERAVAEQRAAELAALPWQTRVWDSISVPPDPVFPENSQLLGGAGLPGGPDTPAVPGNPEDAPPPQPQEPPA